MTRPAFDWFAFTLGLMYSVALLSLAASAVAYLVVVRS